MNKFMTFLLNLLIACGIIIFGIQTILSAISGVVTLDTIHSGVIVCVLYIVRRELSDSEL